MEGIIQSKFLLHQCPKLVSSSEKVTHITENEDKFSASLCYSFSVCDSSLSSASVCLSIGETQIYAHTCTYTNIHGHPRLCMVIEGSVCCTNIPAYSCL